MKRIVCEMCESTDFIKMDGLFVCQECGCKYSMEEAKKMMKEIDDEANQQNKGCFSEVKEKGEEIPIHTFDSPNKISVKVIKVGHETYTAASVSTLSVLFGGEPSPVFADGPDVVGNIGTQIYLENVAGKTIKYAYVYVLPINSVGDCVKCEVSGHSEFEVKVTGPLAPGKNYNGYCDGMWYNNSIVGAKIDRVHVIYMDGSQEMYKGEEFYFGSHDGIHNGKNTGKTSYLSIKRVDSIPTPNSSAVDGANRLICNLSDGKRFEISDGQTIIVSVRNGVYKIKFEFAGQEDAPIDRRETPEFMVNGDTYMEVSFDRINGGYNVNVIE